MQQKDLLQLVKQRANRRLNAEYAQYLIKSGNYALKKESMDCSLEESKGTAKDM